MTNRSTPDAAGRRRSNAKRTDRPAFSQAVDVAGPGSFDDADAANPLSNLDGTNREIVSMLQLDGRRSYASIGRKLDIAEGGVRARVNQLRRDGQLRFIAVVDPVQLGYSSWCMLGITVSAGNSPHELARYFAARPEVTYVMVVAAKYDLLVEICCQTTDALSEFLERHCYASGKIASTEAMIGVKLYKWFAPIPGAEPAA